MPTCTLCENVQPAGEACAICGHPFPVAERSPPPVEPVEGLEATSLPAAGPVDGELPELERTGIDPVQVVVAAMEGLQPTEAEGIPDDGPAPPPAAVCRYCRTPSFPGEAFCAHCGMRLPRDAGAPGAPLPVVFCRDCGTPVQGETCPSCGVRASR